MRKQITLREANQHLSRYIKAVESGGEVLITRRGVPVARLVPVAREKSLSVEQRLARERARARMAEGFSLGGDVFDRDAAHAR